MRLPLPLNRRRLAALSVAFMALGAVAAAQAETLRVTVPRYSDKTEPYFRSMAKAFEAKHPGVTVKIEEVNWDTLLQKLQTDIAGNANADVAVIGTRWLVEFVKDGVAEPLDGYMNPAFKGRFIGSFLAPGQIGGKTYGLPIAASARALYYNKELLAKVGFPEGPKTWADVAAASRKLKSFGIPGFGLQGKEVETDVYWYYSLWTHGGDVIGADGKAAFASDAGVRALTTYKALLDEHLTQPAVTNYNREDVQNLFKKGRVGMVISAPFLSKQIKAEAPTLKYGITALPTQGASATYAVTDSVVMFKNSKVKPLAYQFLDFLFTKAPRVTFSSGEGFLPTTVEEAAAPEFADAETRAFVSLLPTAKFAPTVTGWEDTAKAVSNALQAVYLGKAKPAEALKAAAQDANKHLGK